MKKLFLLLGASSLFIGANAQQANQSLVFGAVGHIAKTPVELTHPLTMPANVRATSTANKTTAAPRWYSHFDDVDNFNSGALSSNLALIPMWYDSTIQQVYSSGLGTINYSAASQYFSPIHSDLFNSTTSHGSELGVTASDAYTVDSVGFLAVYEENMSRPSTVVDTLVISVAPSTGSYRLSKTAYTWAAPYLASSGMDTLIAHTIYNVDSVNRAAFSDVTSATRILWKEPLTAAMRDTGFNIKNFSFKVPGTGLAVPAGYGFSVTVAFKSGDTWVKNVDSIDQHHRWMLLSASTGANTQMPYYYYDLHDWNMSSQMFSTDTSTFLPTVIIEGINTTAFRTEFHDIAAEVVCSTCKTVSQIEGVNNITALGDVSNAYPNPANTATNITFTVKEAANVTVSITNTLGQVVKSQNLGRYNANQNGKATFNTGDLSNGIYFYTIDANGQKVTKRLSVMH